MSKIYEVALKLGGDAKGAVSALKLTDEQMKSLNSTKRAASAHAKQYATELREATNVVGNYALAIGSAASVALGALIQSSAESARELQNLSRISGISTEEFQKMTAATELVGIGAEKFSDQMKDMRDRVGDFIQTGGGPMADFFEKIAPQVGVTAEQFAKLSGPEAMQLYVNSLEKANVSQNDMVFYMEAVASDATALLPLLKDNGEAMKEFAEEIERTGLFLSDVDIARLIEVDASFKKIERTISTLSQILAAELTPYIKAIADNFDTANVNADDFRQGIHDAVEIGVSFVGVFLDAGRAFEIAWAAGDAFFKSIGIGWGQTFDLIKLFGVGLEHEFVEAQIAVKKFWNALLDYGETAINHILLGLRQVPGFGDIQLIEFPDVDTSAYEQRLHDLKVEYDTIQGNIEDGFSEMGKSWQKVSDLMLKELPSEELKRKFKEIREAAEKEFKEISKASEVEAEKTAASYDSILERISATERGQALITEEIEETIFKTKTWATEIETTAESMDSVFNDVFSEILGNFDGFTKDILSGFGGMISEMSTQSGGISNIFSGLFSGGATSQGKGGAAVIGADAALGQGGFGSALQGGAIGIGAGLVANSIGTILDDNASNARRRNNIGLLTGGLGFLLTSSIFGKPSDKTQSAQIDLTSGGITQGGFLSGSKFDQTNRDAADIAAQLLSSISQELSNKVGQDLAGELDFIVGSRDGIRVEFNGEELVRSTEISEVLNAASEKLFELANVSSEVYRDLQLEGETLAESLVRVDSQFEAVNTVADSLGIQFALLGDQGRVAADSLVQAVGGIDSLIAGANYFYDNFFTQEEKFRDLTSSLDTAFGDLNLSIPATREEFKNLVLGLDITTESGQDTYAALINLAPAFDDYIEQLSNQKVTVEGLSGILDKVNVQLDDFSVKTQSIAGPVGPASPFGPKISVSDLGILGAITSNPLSELPPAANDPVTHLGSTNQLYEFVKVTEEYNEVVEGTTNNVVELIDYEKLRADAVKDLTDAYKIEARELESLIDSAGDAASKLREYSDSLLLGNLSALNPQQQFAEARRQFFAAKESGNADAIISAGNTFLTESREFQGSAGSYASDFELVRSTLNATADLADRQKDSAEKQLAQLEKIVSENIELKKEVKTLNESVAALIEVNKAAANAQLNESAKQTDALQGLKSNSDVQVSAA